MFFVSLSSAVRLLAVLQSIAIFSVRHFVECSIEGNRVLLVEVFQKSVECHNLRKAWLQANLLVKSFDRCFSQAALLASFTRKPSGEPARMLQRNQLELLRIGAAGRKFRRASSGGVLFPRTTPDRAALGDVQIRGFTRGDVCPCFVPSPDPFETRKNQTYPPHRVP